MKKLISQLRARYQKYQLDTFIQSSLAGLSEHHKVIYETVLTNTAHLCLSPTKPPSLPSELTMRVTKRVLDQLMVLNHLVSIQPMKGPVGLVYTLQYTSGSDDVRHVKLEVIATAIQAQTARLSAKWCIDVTEDKMIKSGIVDDDIIEAISAEIADEIILQVLQSITKLAVEAESTHSSTVEKLPFAINQSAARIAFKTRRGAGNTIVTSPEGLDMIETCPFGYEYKPILAERLVTGSLMHIGNLCSGEDVVYKVLVTDRLPPKDGNVEFLVVYKGNNDPDAGYVYSPYMPVMWTGIVIDPNTFAPVLGVMSRNAGTANGTFAGHYFNLLRIEKK